MKAELKNFNVADEIRKFEKGQVELIKIGGGVVGRLTLEPGWRWSKHIKPIALTKWCEVPHFQYQISGKLHIQLLDETEFETLAGSIHVLPSGHDAWVVGEETVVLIDWAGAIGSYANFE